MKMNLLVQNKILISSILTVVICMTITLTIVPIIEKQSVSSPANTNPTALPEDVESVLKSYSYSERGGGLQIDISGKQIIRRGKKILGLRSNLVKTNFLEEINGTITGPKGKVTFSASDAEWDADSKHPLMLRKNIQIKFNDKTFSRVASAKIFFNQGLMEVTTDKNKVYNFK